MINRGRKEEIKATFIAMLIVSMCDQNIAAESNSSESLARLAERYGAFFAE